jgi:hypothetical protein
MVWRPSAVSGASGIEEEYSIPAMTNGLVSVTINNTIEALPMKLPENAILKPVGAAPAVDQSNAESACLNDLADGEASNRRIHVTPHDVNGSAGKGGQHIRINYIAGMKDHIDFPETTVQQVLKKGNTLAGILDMRIGKYTDFKHENSNSEISIEHPSITKDVREKNAVFLVQFRCFPVS